MTKNAWSDARKHLQNWERYNIWDRTLYDLCSKHLEHVDQAAVVAKVYLIGRSYQTGIERHSSADGKKGLDAVADVLCRNAKKIDRLIAPLRRLDEVPSHAAVHDICAAHMELMAIAGQFAKRGKPRSFASKYLHFHAPVTPIYDSIASSVISCKGWRDWTGGKAPSANGVDQPYWQFCHRILKMAASWQKANVPFAPTARNLDKYLLGWAQNHAHK